MAFINHYKITRYDDNKTNIVEFCTFISTIPDYQ